MAKKRKKDQEKNEKTHEQLVKELTEDINRDFRQIVAAIAREEEKRRAQEKKEADASIAEKKLARKRINDALSQLGDELDNSS